MDGDLVRYHRLRNRTQRMAAKLRKIYFAAKVEQYYCTHQILTNGGLAS